MRSFSTKHFILAAVLLLCASFGNAQSVRQVIIANGGVFGNMNFAKIASWDPQTNNYFVFDSIPASSVQDVVIDGGVAYVAADSTIRAYDIDNYTVLASADLTGVRKLAIWNNSLIATRGFPVSADFVKVFDKTTLVETATITGLSDQCEGIVVVDDSAYVAVPGSFLSTTGSLAIVDLTNNVVVTEMNLDTVGNGISRVFYHEATDHVYTLNTLTFGATQGGITTYSIGSRNPVSYMMNFSVGSKGGLHGDHIYGIFNGNFKGLSLPNLAMQSTIIAPGGGWAAAIPDTTNNRFYLTETDYFSYGRLSVYDNTGSLLDTLTTGISPEALAIDYRLPTTNDRPFSNEIYITAWPNPVTDLLHVDASRLTTQPTQIDLIDLHGRTLATQAGNSRMGELNVSTVPAGTYFVRVRTQKGDYLKPIVKQ